MCHPLQTPQLGWEYSTALGGALRLIAVGRLRTGPEAELFGRYLARLRPTLELREIAEAAGSPAEIRKREGAALLAQVTGQDAVVALDLGGIALTSEAFAAKLQGWIDAGQKPAFLIGGAEGLDAAVVARADFAWSLGTLTWPHMLVRVMLAEQIFRAQCILSGHPYHRGFRP
jgi:23S rRNA (pseudouridine1915-N3)-methyltransferase